MGKNINCIAVRRLLSSVCLASVAMLSFNAFAQEPLPQGPGPVIAISPGNQPPVNNPQTPPPPPQGGMPIQGPGPAIAVSPPPANGVATPPPPPGWGAPGSLVIPPNADWMNQGTMNVMATGYDSQGVMKQIPLFISYNYNGVQYNITVLNAWNPYTQMWDANVDQPAYSTSYYLNGFTYNWYTVLSTGTFYFNL